MAKKKKKRKRRPKKFKAARERIWEKVPPLPRGRALGSSKEQVNIRIAPYIVKLLRDTHNNSTTAGVTEAIIFYLNALGFPITDVKQTRTWLKDAKI